MSRKAPDPWQSRAECLKYDPEWFFPPGQHVESPAYWRAVERAKTICRACPVSERCYQEAHRLKAQGIWGASTEKERVLLRRRMRRAAASA